MDKDTLFFSKLLIPWYLTNRRELPWRNVQSPYKVWLSEVILQQTRVAQGLPYYERFISHFPTIEDLANATEEKVLLLWQGLGYYTRARNLHAAAKYVVNERNGIFPKTHKELLKLKGVGDYTASAIASICFDEPRPVVDGNVYRFLSRFFGLETIVPSPKAHKEFKELSKKLMGKEAPGTFNQAMMEFGALQCVPKNPNCNICVFSTRCIALQKNKVEDLPVKKKKIKVKKRYFNYFVATDNNKKEILIQKRMKKDIWYKLFQLPLLETESSLDILQLRETISTHADFNGMDRDSIQLINSQEIVHKLTHQHLYTKFWKIKFLSPHFEAISINRLEEFAFPTLIEDFLSEYLEELIINSN